MEEWQARIVVGRLVTTGMQVMIEAEEAKGQLEKWDAYWDFITRYCIGKRTQAFVKSGAVGTAMDVGAVGMAGKQGTGSGA